MPHTLHFDGESVDIAEYLVVHPFTFDPNSGQLLIQPHLATAVVNLVTTQIQKKDGRKQQTIGLPTNSANFEIHDNENTIMVLSGFEVRLAVTPASLDMSRAIWFLRGMRDSNVWIDFTPVQARYVQFARNQGANAYWGATLEETAGVILKASLSVPTYEWQDPIRVSEYLALGPANTHESGDSVAAQGSIFRWLVAQGVPPVIAGDGGIVPVPAGHLNELTVTDQTNGASNTFFGSDWAGQTQVSDANNAASGAVFTLNGPILDTQWRSLACLIRELATMPAGDPAVRRLLDRYPVSVIDQSVRTTARPEERESSQFIPKTSCFEGIALWDLMERAGDEPAAPMHR